MMSVDCKKLHMYNVITRKTTKKVYIERYSKTLQVYKIGRDF